MNFLFACGGTAGHINPAIAVAGRLRELMPECGILFVGARGRMEEDLVPRAGYEIRTVEITNLQRKLNLEGIRHNLATARNVDTSTPPASHTSATVWSPTPSGMPNRHIIWSKPGS